MAIETISYSVAAKGWNSFHSFIPDWMIGLNSSLYTWKNGDLYKHNTNLKRNRYYEVDYSSTITPIFNQQPMDNKVYKTLALWSNLAWKADITTDFTTGAIDSDLFKLKEGEWYGYIRNPINTVDLGSISSQGIGEATWNNGALTFTFTFNFTASVSIGDDIYVTADPALIAVQKVGTVTAFTNSSGSSTITINAAAITPNNGDFVVAVKNSQAESYGLRGSYMEVKLTSTTNSAVELFTVSSDVMKSYP